MRLPDYLKPYFEEGKFYLEKGLIRNIEFSGTTYQVLVFDPKRKKKIWTFLQLDEQGQISDCFCDDEEVEEFTIHAHSNISPCVHLCASYLYIYNNTNLPLHKRFKRSLWNRLCSLFASRLGDSPSLLKAVGKGHYVCLSQGEKVIFEIKGKKNKAIARIEEFIENRPQYSEETSLKFSNLTQEELTLWREGQPSLELKYELSFWSDIAKWLMLMQDRGKEYRISYDYSSKNLPNVIKIEFSSMEVKFYISEANLPLVIPFLNSVESSLRVYDAPEEEIESIIYDKEERCLIIIPQEQRETTSAFNLARENRKKEGIVFDQWLFVPAEGFYAKDPHKLLAKEKIYGKDIVDVLNAHFQLVKKCLVSAHLHADPVEVSYSLAFDADWNLHVVAYLFSPGDLSSKASYFFGQWAYLDDDGFYRLQSVRFPDSNFVVQSEDLSDFIAKNRAWLNSQDGFHVHLTNVESQLSYQLSDDNRLSFLSNLAIKEGAGETKDFGSLIYILGQGFYPKEMTFSSQSLRSGLVLSEDQISLFIKLNREALTQVFQFFSSDCPVSRAGLEIIFNKNGSISVRPAYELFPQYQQDGLNLEKFKFFDDFIYTAGKGFCELPFDAGLQERYRHPQIIEPENVEAFVNFELEALKPFTLKTDVRLLQPDFIQLFAVSIEKDEKNAKRYVIKLEYRTNYGSVPVTKLWKAIKQKKKLLFSEAGLIHLDDKRFNWLHWIQKTQVDSKANLFHLSTIELIRLNALEEIKIEENSEGYKQSLALLQELIEFQVPVDPNLEGLKSQLRPYQIVGIKWLWFLYHYRLSGLLCDDMGLGKTHQAMALMAAIKNDWIQKKTDGRPRILVVCPTSVIYHWEEKIKAHLPHFQVYTFYGLNRNLDDSPDYDVILTSYGICRIESDLLSKIPFELAVFDEMQLAKNHNSRVHATLLAINATMRVGLTGTPIENYLRELKALFDVVLPFYMPNEVDYRELFVKPIERAGDPNRKKLLSRMIKPFMMRRKKQDVLTDLPEKTEEISHCDLEPTQAALYNEVLAQGRERILKDLEDESSQVPYMHIFALLSALKQICNHPAAYLKSVENYKEYESGKWELFIELLSEARESSQKIVVYSQYLSMLDIIQDYLFESGIGFASIRGSTANRRQQLQRFSEDPSCEVFVASLQAAGLGVDLTAASVVIHYDRWWNAARENQATDRVYRIGQKRGVQVFKLVTKNTFEERIDEIIKKKGRLMEEIVGADDHEIIKGFSRREIIEFLNWAPV